MGGRLKTPRRPGSLLAVALVAVVPLAAGCGSDDRVSDPRPPSPIEVTARVGNKVVTVAPNEFGAGLVNITISNQSDDVVTLTVDGEQVETSAAPIQPNAVATFKVELPEGTYEVTAGPDSDARPDTLEVGPERASAQNQLLLP
jgi:hypothetical protein